MADNIFLASHITITAYGFWLPNDPRGSGSKEVRKVDLRPFGPPTFIEDRKVSRAGMANNLQWQSEAKGVLKHSPAAFDEDQRNAIAAGFGRAVVESGYRIHACAVLRKHAHLVVAAHLRKPNLIEKHLKSRATNRLRSDGLWLPDREVWGGNGWIRFIFDADDLRRTICYVNDNPRKEGLHDQNWDWIVPYL